MKYNEILQIIPGEITVIRTENGEVKKYVKRPKSKLSVIWGNIVGNNKEIIFKRVKCH